MPPFRLFGPDHLGALALTAGVAVAGVALARRDRGDARPWACAPGWRWRWWACWRPSSAAPRARAG